MTASHPHESGSQYASDHNCTGTDRRCSAAGQKGIITFVALTFALSSLGYTATIVTGETSILLLFASAAAALITRYVFYRNARDFGWSLPEPRWVLLAYALPFVVSGSMFVLAWAFLGYYTTDKTDTGVLEGLATSTTALVLLISVLGLGEELGWRGYLVPELARSRVSAMLRSSVVPSGRSGTGR